MSAVAVMAELVGVCRPKMADEGVRGRFRPLCCLETVNVWRFFLQMPA